MKTTVWITTSFVGYHRWKRASMDVGYLKDFHRHVFHVKLGVVVSHDDRDVEFIQLKKQVHDFLRENYDEKQFEKSCEMIAGDLANQFDASFVEVSEDNENGARVEQESGKSLPAWEKKRKCFIGVEAEGPLRGKVTLFVPGSVSLERCLVLCKQHLETIEAVYYGAGNDTLCSDTTWASLYEFCVKRGLRVTKEEEDCIFVDEFGMFTKCETEQAVIWYSREFENRKWITLKSDPLYQSDSYVE